MWKDCDFKIEFEKGGEEFFYSYNDAITYAEYAEDICNIYHWDDEYLKWVFIECR